MRKYLRWNIQILINYEYQQTTLKCNLSLSLSSSSVMSSPHNFLSNIDMQKHQVDLSKFQRILIQDEKILVTEHYIIAIINIL